LLEWLRFTWLKEEKMSRYIFIESRDPFESRDTQFVEETAINLRLAGHEVTVFLVQNGVLASRRRIDQASVAQMSKAGVDLLADDFSLCERGIATTEIQEGVRASNIDSVVTALIQEDTKVIWH
jgi:predicted peroxiredoxin